VLLPPQFDQKRRQDLQEHPRAVDAGMTPAADSNKVAVLGDSRPPMMDRERPRAATRMAAGLAEPAVPFPDPFPPAAEEAPIEPMSRVAATAECCF
jgi:hypothetical protein